MDNNWIESVGLVILGLSLCGVSLVGLIFGLYVITHSRSF